MQGIGQIQSSHTQILRCRLWNQLVEKLQKKQVYKMWVALQMKGR
jgi:hypothetical protein